MLMTAGMNALNSVKKGHTQIFLYAPGKGDIAALDSNFGISFCNDDLRALAAQLGLAKRNVEVLDHDSFCIRVRIPGADFNPSNKDYKESLKKLTSLGDFLLKRANKRIGR
jgi:hypothetical protein